MKLYIQNMMQVSEYMNVHCMKDKDMEIKKVNVSVCVGEVSVLSGVSWCICSCQGGSNEDWQSQTDQS